MLLVRGFMRVPRAELGLMELENYPVWRLGNLIRERIQNYRHKISPKSKFLYRMRKQTTNVKNYLTI